MSDKHSSRNSGFGSFSFHSDETSICRGGETSDAGAGGLHGEYIEDRRRRLSGLTAPGGVAFGAADATSQLSGYPDTIAGPPDGSLNSGILSCDLPVAKLIETGKFKAGSTLADFRLNRGLNLAVFDGASASPWLEDLIDLAPSLSDAPGRDCLKNPVTDIMVSYQDYARGSQASLRKQPDFRVKVDGTVEVMRDPDKHGGANLLVELERSQSDRNAPSQAQQQATDRLLAYLAQRFMLDSTGNDGKPGKYGQIIDQQGLVSEHVKASIGDSQTRREETLPPEARDQIHRINRWSGSGNGGRGGRFSPSEAAEQFPHRAVKRQPGEVDKLAALKDVASSFISRGDKDCYGGVRFRAGRGTCVGRYGISSDQFMDWLLGLSDAEIERLIKAGKMPEGALALKRGKKTVESAKLQGFLDKMKSGTVTFAPQEVKEFMPGELQECIGSYLLKSYALQTADKDAQGRPSAVNIGKTALSLVLGRAVTEEESKRPEHSSLMQSARRAYPLALQRAMDGFGPIDLSNAAGKIVSVAQGDVGQQLWLRHAASVEWGNLGCAASVSHVLRDAGVSGVDELSVAGLSSALQRQGWNAIRFSERQPGDVIIATGGKHGHTGIVGHHPNVTYDNHSSDGTWSRDAANYWVSGKWPHVYVLRAPVQ